MQPNLRTTAFRAPLRTNSLGFRGPEWSKEKPANTYRIALLGDSLTFGYGLSYQETYGEILARLLNRQLGRQVEVLNFGVNGYNSFQELAVLRRYVLGYHPDAVILLITINDDRPALWADKDGALHNAIPNSKNPSPLVVNEWSKFVNRWTPRFLNRSLLKNSRLVTFLFMQIANIRYLKSHPVGYFAKGHVSVASLGQTAGTEQMPSDVRDRIYEPVSQIILECRRRRIEVVALVYGREDKWTHLVGELIKNHQVPVIALHSLYRDIVSDLDFARKLTLRWDSHPNAAANARWALALARVLDNTSPKSHR